ncbi:MAG: biotin/lipoyl-binding protein [Brevefilum sp.]|nr:biotin/lipoyl-binding protein [Brevefilum sp.]MDW7754022.1 biotin/lipoyl-containing protein [Brevefilum sp.]
MKLKVIIDAQTYQVEIENIHDRPVIAHVEGEKYEVWPEESTDAGQQAFARSPEIFVPDAQQPPASAAAAPQGGSAKEVLSPLPGVIVAILVKPGDRVQHGQELCTLEAMKMKNAIRSNREGTIASIAVNVGDQVNHGHALMTFEE